MGRSRRYIAAAVLLIGGAALAAAAVGGLDPSATQQALQELSGGRYDQAEQKGLALATDPDRPSPRAWAIVAAARQRRGDYAAAARAYTLFLTASDCPGLRQYALQQIRSCQQALEKVPTPAAPSRQLDEPTLRRLADVEPQTSAESTEHFVVQARNAELAKLIAHQAEVALDRICRVILAGQVYPHSVRINVWTDHEDFQKHAVDAPEWAGGSFRYSLADGQAVRQLDLTQRDAAGNFAAVMLDRVLPHEMCHLVLQEYFGDATCPLFLNEGLACLAEFEVDPARVELAGKVIAGKARIRLDRLLIQQRYDMEQPGVFYAESFSFIEFLHSRLSGEQFAAFLENVKRGCTTSDALQRSLCLPMDDTFLPAVASAWEDHAVAQAQFVQALADRPGAASAD